MAWYRDENNGQLSAKIRSYTCNKVSRPFLFKSVIMAGQDTTRAKHPFNALRISFPFRNCQLRVPLRLHKNVFDWNENFLWRFTFRLHENVHENAQKVSLRKRNPKWKLSKVQQTKRSVSPYSSVAWTQQPLPYRNCSVCSLDQYKAAFLFEINEKHNIQCIANYTVQFRPGRSHLSIAASVYIHIPHLALSKQMHPTATPIVRSRWVNTDLLFKKWYFRNVTPTLDRMRRSFARALLLH